MPSVTSLIGAHQRGDRESLRSLAVALAARVEPVSEPPADPVEVMLDVETRVWPQPNTWQEVVAARDTGALTDAEYDYLSAAVEALTMEGTDDGA